jgi:phosphoribosyl 1,2-cyclic phosphodiesterase
MIDCGADWLDKLGVIKPTVIVLTHAHRDHAAGLAHGAPCPVYATRETLQLLEHYPLRDSRRLPVQKAVTIGRIGFKAVPVHHSTRAPAVGYRVATKAACFFYLPDVAELPDAPAALRGVDVYIGDGATIRRPMLRRQDETVIGHAPITAQLGWCEAARVRRAIFTHCGSPIVRGNARVMTSLIRQLGREHGVDAQLACDGDRLVM